MHAHVRFRDVWLDVDWQVVQAGAIVIVTAKGLVLQHVSNMDASDQVPHSGMQGLPPKQ